MSTRRMPSSKVSIYMGLTTTTLSRHFMLLIFNTTSISQHLKTHSKLKTPPYSPKKKKKQRKTPNS